MAEEYQVADQLIALLEHVDAGHPLRIGEIRQQFGIGIAAARRYREFVGRHRNLVEEREGRGGKVWWKAPDKEAPPATLARAAALDFAVNALGELKGTQHYDELDATSNQARLSLSDGNQTKLDRVTRGFQVRTAGESLSPSREEHLGILMDAIEQRRPCHMRYQRADGVVRSYEVQPWGFILHHGRLLFVAGKTNDETCKLERRIFNVDGIYAIGIREGERFEVPAPRQVNYEEIFRHSFGVYCGWEEPPCKVHLRVRGPNSVLLRRRSIHHSQQMAPGDDEWWDLWLHVIPCPEFRSFVMGMIPDVQIVEPDSLREEVRGNISTWLSELRSLDDQ